MNILILLWVYFQRGHCVNLQLSYNSTCRSTSTRFLSTFSTTVKQPVQAKLSSMHLHYNDPSNSPGTTADKLFQVSFTRCKCSSKWGWQRDDKTWVHKWTTLPQVKDTATSLSALVALAYLNASLPCSCVTVVENGVKNKKIRLRYISIIMETNLKCPALFVTAAFSYYDPGALSESKLI